MSGISYYEGLTFPTCGIVTRSSTSANSFPLFYGIQYIHAGSLYLSVGNGPLYTLKGPLVFLTSPDSVFNYGSPENTSRQHYFICADGPRTRKYVESGLFPLAAGQEKPYTEICSPEHFLADVLDLILMIQKGDQHDFAVAKYEHLLLAIQNQNFQRQRKSIHHQELESLAQRIMRQPELVWNFEAEAAKMNISEKHLLRLFNSVHGMPPVRFVLRQRIFKACTMLLRESCSIKHIAYECGFNSEFYFSRMFRSLTGVSPREYRSRNLSGNLLSGREIQ